MASSKEIPPGGEGKVHVKFKTANKKGPVTKRITVTSNDPVNPKFTLQVKANLEVYFAANQRRIYYGRVNRKAPVTKTITFTGKLIDKIKITDVSMKKQDKPNKMDSAYTWKIIDDRKKDPKNGLKLDITLDPRNQDPQRFRNYLVIKTDNEKVPQLEISLAGEILGPLTASPPRLYFGNYEKDKEMRKTLKIESPEGLEFRIQSVTSDYDGIEIAKVNKKTKSASHEMEVVLKKGCDKQRFNASLTVTTDLKAQPQLEVPINGYKRRLRNRNRNFTKSNMHRANPKMSKVPGKKLDTEATRK